MKQKAPERSIRVKTIECIPGKETTFILFW